MSKKHDFTLDFKRFFFRGLAAILPTILTILLFSWLYSTIGKPINDGTKYIICKTCITYKTEKSTENTNQTTEIFPVYFKNRAGEKISSYNDQLYFYEHAKESRDFCEFWDRYFFAFGFLLAIICIYIIGKFLTSYFGNIGMKLLEKALSGIPFVNQVYSSIKQVTDFLISSDGKKNYSRVVAVEYPSKGLWSIGLATNTGMTTIVNSIQKEMITVFIPSSPTPVTGYTVTVNKSDVIDLPLSIDEALKFTISGGVVIPEHQLPENIQITGNIEPSDADNIEK